MTQPRPVTPRSSCWKATRGLRRVCDQSPKPPRHCATRHARPRNVFEAIYGDDLELLIADRRYGYVHGLAHQVVTSSRGAQHRSTTDRIDDLVAHRMLGLPIFFGLMALVFLLTANASAPFVTWIDLVVNQVLAGWVTALLTALSAPAWLLSLLVDGVLAGVGGVMVFLPVLLVLYFCLAVLEDSGYMARARRS